jgi:hypothetical protein
MANIHHFFSKVVGVTENNSDGAWRELIVADCHSLEHLKLRPEPTNPVDPNAIEVCRADGRQLGYLRAGIAAELCEKVKQGHSYTALVANVTGGDHGRWWGCNILVFEGAPGVHRSELLAHAEANGAALIQDDDATWDGE